MCEWLLGTCTRLDEGCPAEVGGGVHVVERRYLKDVRTVAVSIGAMGSPYTQGISTAAMVLGAGDS